MFISCIHNAIYELSSDISQSHYKFSISNLISAMGLIDRAWTSDNVSHALLHQRMVGIFDLDIEFPAVSRQGLSVSFEQGIHVFTSANGA